MVESRMAAIRLNYDYRCPYTAVVHDTVLDALDAGADWDIAFEPFSLGQAHVADGQLPIWERPDDDSGLEALQVSVVVRDRFPDAFLAVHRGIFAIRFTDAKPLSRPNIDAVLRTAGLEPDDVWPHIDDGSALSTVRDEHTAQVKELEVWGVPTFMIDDQAVFVRLTERSDGDGALATRRIQRVLDLIEDEPVLNEYKHTSIDH